MNKINYAWDSTVVIAWLCDEASAPLVDMELVVNQIDSNQANLIFSVTTFSEILASKYTKEQIEELEKFLKHSNVVRVDTTFPVAQKAAQIRDAGLGEGRKIKTPDATILAVSILFKANVLHSLDKDMLNLNGSPIVDGLRITKPGPFADQPGLFGT